ncbi:MAG: glycosyltransferase family 39 protein [Halothiobacillaceae bacterium]|nr:glycosyltransferase family 39 protein [Halothiobacillaceae bacterium]
MTSRNSITLLALVAFLGFFLNIWGIPLFDLDEGAFTQATREMFLRGDFISPYVNGMPRYDKPVLIHWLQAASVALFGVNEFALRLPSALAATGWMFVVYFFVRQVRDERSAFIAAFMVATALQVGIIGKAAIADAVLNLFMVIALFAIFLHERAPARRWVLLAFAAMGLGFLTKGPVAVLVPFAVSLLYYGVRGQWRLWLGAVTLPAGIALFLLISLPWYVLQYLREGQAFIDGFFLTHNVDRFGGPMEGHGGSLFYYVPVAFVAVMPFAAVLARAVRDMPQTLRDPLGQFLWLWFGFVLVFFSLSGTKLPHYLNYGLTAALILMALVIGRMSSRGWALLPVVLLVAVLLPLPQWITLALPGIEAPEVHAMLSDGLAQFDWHWYAAMGAALLVLLVLMFWPKLSVTTALLGSGVVLSLLVSLCVLPTVGAVQQGPVREAARLARELPGPYVMWRINTPSYSVYSGHIMQMREPQPGDLVLTRSIHKEALGPYTALYESGGVMLARRRPAPPGLHD